MANLAAKKASFIRRYVAAMEEFLECCNSLVNFDTEWQANGYGAGATPAVNNITDADLTPVAPWISQAMLNSSIASLEAMKPALIQQRSALEAIRS